MTLKKKYFKPKIDQVELDVSISLQSISDNTLPGGDGPFNAESTTDSQKESSFKEDDSGFNEDPFKR
jgi:hypothetical protein